MSNLPTDEQLCAAFSLLPEHMGDFPSAARLKLALLEAVAQARQVAARPAPQWPKDGTYWGHFDKAGGVFEGVMTRPVQGNEAELWFSIPCTIRPYEPGVPSDPEELIRAVSCRVNPDHFYIPNLRDALLAALAALRKEAPDA